MKDGRPADGAIYTEYRSPGQMGRVKSKDEHSKIAGWISYRGQCDADGIRGGLGKFFSNDGKVFSGKWRRNVLESGEISEL